MSSVINSHNLDEETQRPKQWPQKWLSPEANEP